MGSPCASGAADSPGQAGEGRSQADRMATEHHTAERTPAGRDTAPGALRRPKMVSSAAQASLPLASAAAVGSSGEKLRQRASCVASLPGNSVFGVAGVQRSEPPEERWGQVSG